MRKLGLWDEFDQKHKCVGSYKENESIGLDIEQVLKSISEDQLQQLLEVKKSEMEMFGYIFDAEKLSFDFID